MRSSFTLIELLVVIAIVAILAVIVILVLNPAELLRQGRDASRVSDLAQLNQTLNLFQTDGGASFGTASTTYVSIPDPTATSTSLGNACTGLGLPSLPSGVSYHCAASSTYRNTNGTGWVPVNFGSISFGSPLGVLPIDPVNTTSSGLYYTYTSGGSWEMTALMESQKYQANEATDGGQDPAMYEAGSNLSLAPFAHGLVGYWSFDAGSGSTVADGSGYGNTGLWNGTGTVHWVAGKVGASAGQFNGTNDWINLGNASSMNITGPITLATWVNPSKVTAINPAIITKGRNPQYALDSTQDGNFQFQARMPDLSFLGSGYSTTIEQVGKWYFVAGVYDGSTMKIYINGAVENSGSGPTSLPLQNVNVSIGWPADTQLNTEQWSGLIDDVRIYNRALSAAEISAIYNATK